MKIKTTVLALFVFSLISALPSSAQQKELPWYFPPGVIQTNDPVKQRQEYLRYLAAQYNCYQGNRGVSRLILGNDSIRVVTNVVSTATATPTKLTLVFDHYVRVGDKIRVTTLCGQQLITEEEFKVVSDDLLSQALLSRDKDFEYYRRLTDRAVKSRAEELGISEGDFRKQLDEKVPDQPDVTYRELNQIPRPQKPSDFVPKEIHLGYNPEMPGVLGVAWLNIGLVYYNPQARVRDYLVNHPGVLMHEIIHSNTNLQDFPLTEGFDVELIASIPEMLVPENQMDFFFHGYASDIRKIVKIYFGFKFDQAWDEIVRHNAGGQLFVDEAKYRLYFGQLEQVKSTLLKFYEEVVLPEFYSKRLWWTAMNDRRKDDNSVFRIMMSHYFDRTGLGGHAETTKWEATNNDTIYRIAKESFEEMGRNGSSSDTMENMRVPQFLVNLYKNNFTDSERLKIEKYFRDHPAELKDIVAHPEKVVEYMKMFQSQSNGGVK